MQLQHNMQSHNKNKAKISPTEMKPTFFFFFLFPNKKLATEYHNPCKNSLKVSMLEEGDGVGIAWGEQYGD